MVERPAHQRAGLVHALGGVVHTIGEERWRYWCGSAIAPWKISVTRSQRESFLEQRRPVDDDVDWPLGPLDRLQNQESSPVNGRVLLDVAPYPAQGCLKQAAWHAGMKPSCSLNL